MDPVMKRMRDLPIDHLSYSGNKHVCYLQYISCISRTSLYVMPLKHRRRSKAMLLIFVYIYACRRVLHIAVMDLLALGIIVPRNSPS